MKQYIYEDFKTSGLKIEEASSSLPEGVLAKVSGPSFFLDGYSRNGRFYPQELWENALKKDETKVALNRGLMFGCIGHPKNYSLDELLEAGKVSHKVTGIKIDKNRKQGIAQYEILDTPSGRILNTILRAGSEMYVSTRASGGYTNETKTKDGKKYKILDSKNFLLESIDFVIQPGFLETNPKLVESIKEDLKILEDSKQLICENGICNLIESKDDVEKSETEMLDNLSKEDLIKMLENVINENKILVEDNLTGGTASNGDMMVSAKLMANYVAYVELLTKMVRYNIEYEKYYDQLIEFLDKDAKLSTGDMEKLNEICDEILKEKDVEESIIKICERIKELSEKINSDGEENNKDKTDKEGKDGEERDKEKEDDDTPEVKAVENYSIVDFMFEMNTKTEIIEKEIIKEDTEKIAILQGKIEKLKEATISLTQQLSIEPEVKVETVTETKTIYKIPDDINEKFISLNTEVETLSGANSSLKGKLEEAINEKISIEDKFSETEETILSLQKELKENEKTFQEALKEADENYNKITDAYSDYEKKSESKLENLEKSLVEKSEENDKYKDKLFETTKRYYATFYRLELPIVEKIMTTYDNRSQIEKALKNEEKLNKKREVVIETELPNYKPKKTEKSKFLENLIR